MTEPLMQDEAIQRSRAQVVNAVGVAAVEFSELLGKDLDGEVLEF